MRSVAAEIRHVQRSVAVLRQDRKQIKLDVVDVIEQEVAMAVDAARPDCDYQRSRGSIFGQWKWLTELRGGVA